MKKINDIKKYFGEINENLLQNHKLLFSLKELSSVYLETILFLTAVNGLFINSLNHQNVIITNFFMLKDKFLKIQALLEKKQI